MKDITTTNFGLLIAFVVPGLTAIWGASYFSDTLQLWLRGSPTHAPTVGGFMYVTIAAIAAGVTVSAVRWAFLDTLHHHTGIPRPDWDFSRLQQNAQAYTVLLENHYRFYQFYSNLLMSLVFLYASRRLALGLRSDFGWFDLGFLILVSILFLGSRDTLQKYYVRVGRLLSRPAASDAFSNADNLRPTWTSNSPPASEGLRAHPPSVSDYCQPPSKRHPGKPTLPRIGKTRIVCADFGLKPHSRQGGPHAARPASHSRAAN